MQTEEQKKKRKKILKIVGAVAAILLLVSCCGIGGLAFLGEEPPATPAPTVVATAAATATLMPMPTAPSTPRPTWTPTPQPTAWQYDPSPVLTLTPIPEEAEVDAKYISGSIALLERYGEAMGDWGEWAGSFEEHTTYKGWAVKAVPILAEVLIVGEEIRGLQPSPRFEASHQVLCEATRHYDAAVHLTAEGLDTLDTDLIAEAVVEMNLGTNLLAEGKELLPD